MVQIMQKEMAVDRAIEAVSDMPLHENFFIRGMFNAVLPQFLNPFESEINERSISGELLEMLRDFSTDLVPDLKDGEAIPINYDMVNSRYNLDNIFSKKEFQVDGFAEQIKMALGNFMLYKENGVTKIADVYDFPEIGEWQQYTNVKTYDDYKKVIAENPDKRSYFYARFMGERLMNEGRDDNLRVNINLPQVAAKEPESDYEPSVPEGAESTVFRGEMSKKRWNIFSGLISPAGAAEVDSVPTPAPRPPKMVDVEAPLSRPTTAQIQESQGDFAFEGPAA